MHTYRERDDKRRRALEEEVKELLQELRAMGVSEEDIQALCREMCIRDRSGMEAMRAFTSAFSQTSSPSKVTLPLS